jgi:hypothetical protein
MDKVEAELEEKRLKMTEEVAQLTKVKPIPNPFAGVTSESEMLKAMNQCNREFWKRRP